MAQYDEFGRPIYETAEEYNKAHKGGVCPRTYDSPEGDNYQHKTIKDNYRFQSATQRHATRQGSKKAKTMVIGLLVFFLVLNVVVVGAMFGLVRGVRDDIYQDYEENWVETEYAGGGEYLGDAETPLPEGFESFSYNGQSYSLPTYYEKISHMGFGLDAEYDENDTFPEGYEEMIDLVDEDGYSTALIRINSTEDDVPLGKCMVDYFCIDNPAIFDEYEEIPDFVFGDEFTFESSYEELESYFGIPYYYYKDHGDDYTYDSYEWAYYGEDEIQYVNVTFWNGMIENVAIEKKAYEDKY